MGACRSVAGLLAGSCLLLIMTGCGDLPFVKKTPPPAPEPVFEPPPPAPLPPLAAPSPGIPASGPTPVLDSRLADLANQVEALRVRLQAVEGKLA